MSFILEGACGSYIGKARNENQDNFYFNNLFLPDENKEFNGVISCTFNTNEVQAFALFDGMGGESNGKQSSLIAATTFAKCVKSLDSEIIDKNFFIDYCNNADNEVSLVAQSQHISSSGTTFAGLVFKQDKVFMCNVGDSKIFRIYDNKITQISVEHTDKEVLEKIGVDKKPTLLQYLGMKMQGIQIEPFVSKGSIKPNNYFVLCSDGVTDVVAPSSIFKFIKKYENPELVVQSVLNEVEHRNGLDNSTIIVIKTIE